MSDPSGFYRLRIGDGGTQRMAKGEDDLGSHVDEDLLSSSSRVDAAKVITWLRPVRESRGDAFWKKLDFPPNVGVLFSSSGPHFTTCTEEDRGGMNFMYWSKVHISEELKFSLPPLVRQFFHFTQLHLIHTHVNMIRVFSRVCVLNRKDDVRLGLEEVFYAYTIKRHKFRRYYLVADAKSLQLVTNLPNTSKNEPQGNVLLFGV